MSKFTIKDVFEKQLIGGSLDVYGNIADEFGVAFDFNTTELTEEGKKYFGSILDTPVESYHGILSVKTDEIISDEEKNKYSFYDYDSYPPKVQLISELFFGAAGHISETDYKKYFRDMK